MPEFLGFDEEAAQRKGRELTRLFDQDAEDREPAIKQKTAIRNMYYGLNKLRPLRYPGQTNINLPVITEKIESFVGKEMNAFWAAEPHAHAQRVPIEHDPDETLAVEKMVNYAIDTDIPNLYQTFESWLRNRHLDSVSFLKIWYNFEERYTVFVQEASTTWKAGDVDFTSMRVQQDRPKVPVEVLGSLFPKVIVNGAFRDDQEIDPLQEQELVGLDFNIDFVEDQIQYTDISIQFRASRFVGMIDVYTHRPYPVCDNVEVEVVEFEDLLVPYRTKDIQSAPRVAQKYWLTIDEIKQRRKFDGWMLTDTDMELLAGRARITADEDDLYHDTQQLLKDQKDVVAGQQNTQMSSPATLEPYSNDKLLILECYVRDDLDGDGVPEEVIYQIPYALRKIVKTQYLEEVFPHGRRPFAVLHSIPISNRFYGYSLGRMLLPINLEVDTIINMVNDAQELINNPFFFYVPTAMPGDPKMFTRLLPGMGIPIADPNGIIFPKFPQQPLANLSTMDSLLLFADRLTVSPQAVGSSQVRNAPRTARGTLALLSEAGAKVDSFITAAQKGGWGELIYQIYALYDAFGSKTKWEKVTGRPRNDRMRPMDLENRVRFTFKGNSVNTNPEIRRTVAQIRYNTLVANPRYAADPNAMDALIADFLRHFSEGTDWERLMPQPATGGGRLPMGQDSETEVIIQGIPLDVLPIDDDTSHIKSIEQFRHTSRFEDLTQDQVAWLAFHELQHKQQLLVKQQQGQTAPGGTQGNNVPLGITQDLNSLEGGVV